MGWGREMGGGRGVGWDGGGGWDGGREWLERLRMEEVRGVGGKCGARGMGEVGGGGRFWVRTKRRGVVRGGRDSCRAQDGRKQPGFGGAALVLLSMR